METALEIVSAAVAVGALFLYAAAMDDWMAARKKKYGWNQERTWFQVLTLISVFVVGGIAYRATKGLLLTIG